MDDDGVSALEETVADLGLLLVQMDKFRAAHAPEGVALRRACLAIGDRARRAHRHGALDAALAADLGADAAAARTALVAWLAAVRTSPEYAAAAAALAAGDDARLRASLPAVFDGASAAAPPPALFASVDWQRRGRPRPAAEIAAAVARTRAEGFSGDTDAGAPGVDPALPGVVLATVPPPGAPLFLSVRVPGADAWVLTLPSRGDAIVPGARALLPFTVVLASPDAELDEWTMDPEAFLRELEAALAAEGLAIERA